MRRPAAARASRCGFPSRRRDDGAPVRRRRRGVGPDDARAPASPARASRGGGRRCRERDEAAGRADVRPGGDRSADARRRRTGRPAGGAGAGRRAGGDPVDRLRGVEVREGGDPARRARLLREGPGARGAFSPHRQRARVTRPASRERQSQGAAARALRAARAHRAVPRHAGRARSRGACRADRCHGPHPGRIRDGQGSDRQGGAPREPARGAPVRRGQLRRGARDVARVGAVRLRAGRIHRRRRRQARTVRGGRRGDIVPGRDRGDAGHAAGEAAARAPER